MWLYGEKENKIFPTKRDFAEMFRQTGTGQFSHVIAWQ